MEFQENANTLCCLFTGSLSSDVCDLLETELEQRVAMFLKDVDHPTLVFDLKDVVYISSAFLRLCLYYCKMTGSKHFSVKNVSMDIRKIFQLAGFTEMMNIT